MAAADGGEHEGGAEGAALWVQRRGGIKIKRTGSVLPHIQTGHWTSPIFAIHTRKHRVGLLWARGVANSPIVAGPLKWK